MKRTPGKTPAPPAETTGPVARDTLCKRLAEEYPAQFARWLSSRYHPASTRLLVTAARTPTSRNE